MPSKSDEETSAELVARHAESTGRVALMWSDVHAKVGLLFEDLCASAAILGNPI
jgi:hypothetical protein